MNSCVKVTEYIHPMIFKALRTIDLDNGMVNRLEPAKEIYHIQGLTESGADLMDRALSGLTPDELETFCAGEFSEIAELRARSNELAFAGDILDQYFEGEDS